MDCSTPGFSVLYHLLDLAQTQVRSVRDTIQPSCPSSFPTLAAFRIFSNESALRILWPKYWHFSFNMKWSGVKVTQSCPTLSYPMDYTVHGILQAGIVEWVAFPFSRGSSQPRNQTGVFCIADGFFTNWAIREAFSFRISPSNEYSALIFLRIDWLDLLAIQGTLKSLLQHHSWKASIFQHSVLLTVQLSHPYM